MLTKLILYRNTRHVYLCEDHRKTSNFSITKQTSFKPANQENLQGKRSVI